MSKAKEYGEPWVKYKCAHCGKEIIAYPGYKEECEHLTKGKNPKKYTYPFDFNGVVWENVPSRLKELVKRPDYGNLLIEETGKRIVGEKNIREAIIVALGGGRLVKNSDPISYNLMASAPSGSGKDYVVDNCLKVLAPDIWCHRSRLSEKALSYWHPSEEEPHFSWTGKILYCEDVSDSFLNSDTVKIMMTGGSHITIVEKGRAKTIKVNGTPLFVITSAETEPNKELSRRVTIAPLDASEEQTQKILDFEKEVSIKGFPEYDQDLIYSTYLTYHAYLTFPNYLVSQLQESFCKNLQSRTNFKRLLDLIKANAALHQYSRKKDKSGAVIVNETDVEVGKRIFLWLYPSRNASLTHAQTKVLEYLKGVKHAKSAAELFREVGNFHYSQVNKMTQCLRSLASKGFINISEGDVNNRPTDMYSYIPEETPPKKPEEPKKPKEPDKKDEDYEK